MIALCRHITLRQKKPHPEAPPCAMPDAPAVPALDAVAVDALAGMSPEECLARAAEHVAFAKWLDGDGAICGDGVDIAGDLYDMLQEFTKLSDALDEITWEVGQIFKVEQERAYRHYIHAARMYHEVARRGAAGSNAVSGDVALAATREAAESYFSASTAANNAYCIVIADEFDEMPAMRRKVARKAVRLAKRISNIAVQVAESAAEVRPSRPEILAEPVHDHRVLNGAVGSDIIWANPHGRLGSELQDLADSTDAALRAVLAQD